MTIKGSIFDDMKSIQEYCTIDCNSFVAVHSSAITSEDLKGYDLILVEGSAYTEGTNFENTTKALSHLMHKNQQDKIAVLIGHTTVSHWKKFCDYLDIPIVYYTGIIGCIGEICAEQQERLVKSSV